MNHATWQKLIENKKQEEVNEIIAQQLITVERAMNKCEDQISLSREPMPEVCADLERRGFSVMTTEDGNWWVLSWW
jgi:recombinational DNA repair protein RecR